MATIFGCGKYRFGTGFDAARLPEGWTLEESPDDWARGIDPDGRRHFLSDDHACPEIMLETGPGIDVSASIPLLQVRRG
jgi:hypothetical protein